MTKLILFGASLYNNFGGPSLLHGAETLWKKHIPDLQITYLEPKTDGIFPFPAHVVNMQRYNIKKLLISAFVYRISKKIIGDESTKEFIKMMMEADAVVDMWGIAFADQLEKRKGIKALLSPPVGCIGMLLGKLIINNTSSYGPIKYKNTAFNAKKYLDRWCSLVLCRERKSKEELKKIGIKKELLVCPDTALAMVSNDSGNHEFIIQSKPTIGISVSYQMKRQSGSRADEYINTIVFICDYLLNIKNFNVLLIPNETRNHSVDDVDICKEIQGKLPSQENIDVIEVDRLTAPQLKGVIKKCDVVIASRYHTVVAALSAMVPTIAIGWHNKYVELMEHYAQPGCLLSIEDLGNNDLMIKTFNKVLSEKEAIRKVLLEKNRDVSTILEDGAIAISETLKKYKDKV